MKDDEIVLDALSERPVEVRQILAIVKGFISKRKEAAHYSTDIDGDRVFVHSADPIAASRKKTGGTLPPNLLKCPFCSFVTPYEEMYIIHTRSHGFT